MDGARTGATLKRSHSYCYDNKENIAPTPLGTARCSLTMDAKTIRYSRTSTYEYDISTLYTNDTDEGDFTLPGPTTIDGAFEWEVECILAVRAGVCDPEFLVKWWGWPTNASTWEPLPNLTHCGEALADFFDLVEQHQAQLASVA